MYMHYCDHPEASNEERVHFHENCKDHHCKYKKHIAEGENPDNYSPNKAGFFSNLSEKAHVELLKFFSEQYGSEFLLSRCMSNKTQNQCESIHQRVFNIVGKQKKHSYARIQFSCQHIAMEHSFGKFHGSLHHHMGTMTKNRAKRLREQDMEMLGNARRKYNIQPDLPSKKRKSRGKHSYIPGAFQ